jgi:hypothetical protein
MEYTIELFYDKLFKAIPIDERARLVWVGVKDFASRNPGYFESEEGQCMWLLDELVELYRMTAEEIDSVYWMYQQAKVEASIPPNG